MSYPQDLLYTRDHEWIRIEGDVATVGVTDFAQKELGDIVFVEVNTVGDTLQAGAVFGTVEAVKTVSDLFLPIEGTLLELNAELENQPELVNQDPYGKGWMVKVKMSNPADRTDLLTADQYKELL